MLDADRSAMRYRPAGQDVVLPVPVPELEPFAAGDRAPAVPARAGRPRLSRPPALSSRTVGWVGGARRQVESWSAPSGLWLRVAGGSEFCIAPGGDAILRVSEAAAAPRPGEGASGAPLAALDKEILIGPALVLALALRGTWCLHASAVLRRGRVVAFLGESADGKSTLAAHLARSGPGWCLVADDILPVTADPYGVWAWPRFPQLKLALGAQPGAALPERLPVAKLVLLSRAGAESDPELELLSPAQGARALLGNTAGSRLFDAALLGGHLAFCAQAAGELPVYRLVYPHRRDALPAVLQLLESSC